ncbi:MAG: RNA polymerase sigma factor [Planctomycetota bacterium]
MLDVSDKELVREVRAGNREAYGQLVMRYERGLRAVIAQIVLDIHVAEELAQDAFVKAFQNLNRLQNPSRFGPWLYKIARHEALMWVRRKPKVTQNSLSGDMSLQQSNGRLSEASEQLLEAVMTLPSQEQRVVLLRYFEGHPVGDIARMIGRPIGTVTKQLSRAHARLRRQMEARRL